MTDAQYGLRSIVQALPAKLSQYLEAQYHIWNEGLVNGRRSLLAEAGVISAEPYIEATPAYLPGAAYDQLDIPKVVSRLLKDAADDGQTGIPSAPYLHQATALERFFAGRELVISTGTGSGKTESFLMPVLGSLAIERAERPASYATSATRALLLYPMNALVNDQMSRLRRLIGSETVANALARADGYRPTFGMYTSRTPYPGLEDAQRTQRDVGNWIDQFFIQYTQQRQRLIEEGKWPAKDLAAFRQSFVTSPHDAELLTRHEMHRRPPDVLVTNYSMLEYMLLRPVDSPIFNSTRNWLAGDSKNNLIVVLDEAHLYQGAQGTEVSLLLRRLVSRLRITRDRVRFILTSASLASGPSADTVSREFAAQLTGARTPAAFEYIKGTLATRNGGAPATSEVSEAFASIAIDPLVEADHDFPNAQVVASALADRLHSKLPVVQTSEDLRDALYSILVDLPVTKHLTNLVMGTPLKLSSLASILFPVGQSEAALDGLLAAVAFSRRKSDQKPLLPMRAHLLFRGLNGIYACIDPECTANQQAGADILLGRLYSRPRIRCECGARVYELMTHRECGAAFLRAFYRPSDPGFLWHEPSTGRSGQGQTLSELHLLVEHRRDQDGGSDRVWLSKRTGRITTVEPGDPARFIELRRPVANAVMISGRNVATFDRECPVCLGTWNDPTRPKIMDLATKGEDPFAHLIATQVRLQPPSRRVSRASPNGGRKSLLFSDGRQKAARLARDVPRVIEQDAFRQLILLSASRILEAGREARLTDSALYVAFVSVVSQKMLHFFDGTDAEDLGAHLRTFEDAPYSGDLQSALSDPWEPRSPQAFRMNVMRTLGSKHYSIFALGLGYVLPRRSLLEAIKLQAATLGFAETDVVPLVALWIQGLLQHFALYGRTEASRRSRELAAGYPVTQAGARSGFSEKQRRRLSAWLDLAGLEGLLTTRLTEPGDATDRRLLTAGNLVITPALDAPWFRCASCTFVAPVVLRGQCGACGSRAIIQVPPGGDTYLRARKAFWRDPVERTIRGLESPITLNVQEHTAQLGYRDSDDVEATTESYERRFRDILIADEQSIDVLSCTTTMEVGIDIGSLVAVGLRNMPPSRHNYQQRAGRAGRRGSAVSTVITYAQNNAHDSYLYEHPEELIAGHPKLTGLDTENPALVERHAFAEIIQEFFEDNVVRRAGGNIFAALGDTAPFFRSNGDGSLVALKHWITAETEGQACLSRISAWLPNEARLSASACRDRLLARLDQLSSVASGVLPKGEDRLIEFLFARGVLPAYAFPRDLVSFQIEELDSRRQVVVKERLQQGANVALSEYAPGRLVVVNKQTYRIGAVSADMPQTESSRARPLFVAPAIYLQCANCLYTASPGTGTAGVPCPICSLAQLQLVTVIQPEVVWAEGRGPIDELDDDQTITDTTVAQLPVPASTDAFETETAFGPASRLLHGRQVPLIIMNRGEVAASGPTGFQVCDQCGYTAIGGKPFQSPHERHYFISARGQPVSRTCSGTPRSVYLGYEFRTDVLLFQTPLTSPFIHDLNNRATWPPLKAALNSVANAFALTSASHLDIDPRELQCGFRLQRTAAGAALADVYIYDTLAGGAGYARLVGENFQDVFSSMRTRLAECDCDSSCTKCLRTYSNRMTHDSLDRFLALDLSTYFQTGQAPSLLDHAAQYQKLLPVREALDLDGWITAPAPTAGVEAHRNGRTETIAIAPALIDPSIVHPNYPGTLIFSDFDVQKDFPSCIARLPS